MQLLALQARAMEGTRPSMVTRAMFTNTPKLRPSGAPWYSAMAAPFSRAAYTSQGPIIHPA